RGGQAAPPRAPGARPRTRGTGHAPPAPARACRTARPPPLRTPPRRGPRAGRRPRAARAKPWAAARPPRPCRCRPPAGPGCGYGRSARPRARRRCGRWPARRDRAARSSRKSSVAPGTAAWRRGDQERERPPRGRPSRRHAVAPCLLGGLRGGGGLGSRLGARLGVARQVFLDARLAALELAQVVQLAGADGTAALHLDRVDGGAVALEHALHAVAVGYLAHGERGVQAGVLLRDHHALVGLDTLAVALLHLHVDHDGVAGAEDGELALGLRGFEVLQQGVEGG